MLVKLKSQKDKILPELQYYPSSFADGYNFHEYWQDIFPYEYLMVKGKLVNCKGLSLSISKAVNEYIEEAIKEQ